jgi:uncharacterized membrane protein YebE (DUF533 family)
VSAALSAADADMILDKLLRQMIADNLAAQGGDPALASVVYARIIEALTPEEVQTLGKSDGTTRLVNDWRAARANVVPFRPRLVTDAGTEEAGA